MKTMKVLTLGFFLLCAVCSAAQGFTLDKDARMALMWQVQKNVSDSDLEFMKKKGINLIQSFAVATWSDEEIKNYLDRAEKHKLGVIMTIIQFKSKGKEGFTLDSDRASAFIRKWKDHPAVYAWHPFDEPTNPDAAVPKPFQRQFYSFIKKIDNSHKVFLSWNATSEAHYRETFDETAFDILDIHAYVRDVPGRRQQSLLDQHKKHRKKAYPVLITVRAFNGGNRPDLSPDGLRKQYQFFFKENRVTDNIGFYGWDLSPNRGINQNPDIMRQFRDLIF